MPPIPGQLLHVTRSVPRLIIPTSLPVFLPWCTGGCAIECARLVCSKKSVDITKHFSHTTDAVQEREERRNELAAELQSLKAQVKAAQQQDRRLQEDLSSVWERVDDLRQVGLSIDLLAPICDLS